MTAPAAAATAATMRARRASRRRMGRGRLTRRVAPGGRRSSPTPAHHFLDTLRRGTVPYTPMAFSWTRPALRVRALLAVLGAGAALASGGVARAAKNDLQLLNLCTPAAAATLGGTPECSWVQRAAPGNAQGTTPGLIVGDDGRPGAFSIPAEGQAAFRSLMSELGVVIAPRLQTPAD